MENDRFRAGLTEAKRELQTIPPATRREMVKVGRVMDEEGRKSGSLLARGLHSGLIRNSPLIVAGVGAALAAGAPVMTAAAGTLFAGVGAVAAAQTIEVREAWTDLGHEIRDGAVADAAVLVPVYTEMADEIGGAFRRMRPQLREAFSDSAPLIRSFTGGVVDLAENAMPGLARAIASAGPVFAGLERFLSTAGTGLSDFFDAISGHGPAAGSIFASLGDIIGDLLPIVGELLGQGAELAADVLPAVAFSTGLTLDVLQALGPLLPPIVAGFVAFKAAQLAAGYLQTFAVQAQYATIAMSGSVSAGTKVGGALSSLGRSLPLVGIAVGLLGSQIADGERQMNAWAEALSEGGVAAESARKEMDDLSDTWDGWKGVLASLAPGGAHLTETLSDNSRVAGEAEQRARELTRQHNELALQEQATAYAIQGVTSAMVEQAAQALAGIDSGFAYQHALNGLEDAQAGLSEAVATYGAGSEEAQRAQLGLEEQAYRTALAFGQQQADLSGLAADSDAYKRLVQEEMLRELHRLQDAAGPEMKAALGVQIAALEASGVTLAGTAQAAANTAQQMRDLGLTVTQVPGNKSIFIDAPTAEQKKRIEDLGLAVRYLPNGKVVVTADTSPAEGTLAWFMSQRRTIQIQAQVNTGGIRYQGAGQQPTRAAGGPVWPNQTFLVGEKGPELVQFAGPGHVFNAQQTASMMGAAPAPRVVGGGSSAPSSAGSRAPNVTVQFYVDGQEFRGMARAVVSDEMGRVADEVHYAGGA